MPQWPGTNENFALIIGMYFKILSVPNYGKRVFYVHLSLSMVLLSARNAWGAHQGLHYLW